MPSMPHSKRAACRDATKTDFGYVVAPGPLVIAVSGAGTMSRTVAR